MIIQPSGKISFKRALTTPERIHAETIQKEAKTLLDIDKTIIITPETSLPKTTKDIGVGQLNQKKSLDFYKFMKSYAGINAVKVLPPGELHSRNGFYCSYATPALTLGSHSINLEKLTTAKMGNILSTKTFKKVIKENQNSPLTANYENVVGDNSPHNRALKEAYNNFKESLSLSLDELKNEFEIFKTQNSEIIENNILFKILAKKNKSNDPQKWYEETERELFNTDIVPVEKRNSVIAKLKAEYEKEIDFEYFKQFLAEKNLAEAKKQLNENGLKLYGDCLINFSQEEIWANPKAFLKDTIVGSPNWSARALDYTKITDENSESFKILSKKIAQFAKRYDSIRFDVGWAYTEPIFFNKKTKLPEEHYVYDKDINGYRLKNPLGDKLLEKIEKVVKSIKGEDFDTKNLIYEIEAGEKDFTCFNWNENKGIKQAFKNRTIVQSTCYMDPNYASINMLEGTMKVPRDNYVYMVGNHDHIALNALAHGKDNDKMLKSGGNNIKYMLEKQYKGLAQDLKIDENAIKTPAEFIKAKFAQVFMAKNIKLFFNDIFGSSEQYDSQISNSAKNYRTRIPQNFESAYHQAVQEERGFNLYDAMAKAMKARNLDTKNKTVYNELEKIASILKEKGVLTESDANIAFGVIKENGASAKPLLAAGVAILLITGIIDIIQNRKTKH